MASEIALASSIHLKVLRNVVKATAVIVIDRERRAIIPNEEIARNDVVARVEIRLWCLLTYVSKKRLAVLFKHRYHCVSAAHLHAGQDLLGHGGSATTR